MKKLYALVLLLPLAIVLCSCGAIRHVNPFGHAPVQVDAYRTIVGARAFTHSVSDKHLECGSRNAADRWMPTGNQTLTCQFIDKSISAKDVLIDLTEVYCSSPNFDTGGPCTPPSDQTVQNALSAKLRAAIATYLQAESDLKGVLK